MKSLLDIEELFFKKIEKWTFHQNCFDKCSTNVWTVLNYLNCMFNDGVRKF